MKKEAIVFFEPKGTILEIIRAAKLRGLYVIAICSDPSLLKVHAPYDSALSSIDEIINISAWSNSKELENVWSQIENNFNIKGLYGGMDICAFQLATYRKKLSLPSPDPSDIQNTLDKYKLRSTLRKNGLSNLKSYNKKETDLFINEEWPFDGSAYFKPSFGSFSAFVAKCKDYTQFRSEVKKWNSISTTEMPKYLANYMKQGEFLLEEEIEGELLSVEAITTDGNFQVLGLLSRILYSKNPVVEMGSCFPYPHKDREKIIALVKKAHEVLGLNNLPTHTELIVSKTGQIEIIDLNPRFVGADVLQSINFAYKIKIQEFLLNYALGEKFSLPTQTNNYACLQYFLPPVVPTFQSVEFPKDESVKFCTSFIKPGTAIESTERQIDYLGCYLTVGSTFLEAIFKSNELRSQVKINSSFEGVY